MTSEPPARERVFAALLAVWSGGDARSLEDLLTDDYLGHMLHLDVEDRTKATYPERIAAFRQANPGVRFRVVDQRTLADGLFTRLVAVRADGARADGMNQSRFENGLIAEEWALWSDWRSP